MRSRDAHAGIVPPCGEGGCLQRSVEEGAVRPLGPQVGVPTRPRVGGCANGASPGVVYAFVCTGVRLSSGRIALPCYICETSRVQSRGMQVFTRSLTSHGYEGDATPHPGKFHQHALAQLKDS